MPSEPQWSLAVAEYKRQCRENGLHPQQCEIELIEAHCRIAELEAETVALRVDAERYRYLTSCGMLCLNGVGFDSPESFAVAIDKCVAERKAGAT